VGDTKTNILLISYVFPPYYGIGGRRWARHAEALTELNYRVHVICAKNQFKKTSLWYDNIKNNPNIILYQLPAKYPSVLVNYPKNLIQKIEYKIWDAILPMISKGSYYDRTLFWKKPMLKTASSIIEKYNIKHVICTGGPFSVMYYATQLKEKFAGLFLLSDFRDPWTWGPNWGYSSLSVKRMKYEKELERKTVERSDVISIPGDGMQKYFEENYPDQRLRLTIIPHFYDPNEINPKPKETSDKVRFILYGTIYQNMSRVIKKTAEMFARFKDRVILDIYSDQIEHKQVFMTAGATNVTIYQPLPPKQLFEKFINYDYVYLLNPNYNTNNISTKFYEIIASRTPVWLVSDYGKGAEFLKSNDLGIWVTESNMEEQFEKLLNKQLIFNYNSSFNIRNFALPNVAKQISEILKKRSPLKIDNIAF